MSVCFSLLHCHKRQRVSNELGGDQNPFIVTND